MFISAALALALSSVPLGKAQATVTAPTGVIQVSGVLTDGEQATAQSHWNKTVGVTIYLKKKHVTIDLNWPDKHADSGSCVLASAALGKYGQAIMAADVKGEGSHTYTTWDAPDVETNLQGGDSVGTGKMTWLCSETDLSITFSATVYRNTTPGHNESFRISGRVSGIKKSKDY